MNSEELPPITPKPPKHGLAIASLVLGIVGICLSLFLVGGVLGLVGAALGLTHILGKKGRVTMAWWGVSLSVMSILATIGLGFVYFQMFKAVRETMAQMETGGGVTEWEDVRAPDITVTNLEGKTIRLGELKGKRVVLDFWATWCGPCVKEIPEFIRLYNETPHDELVIVGISEEDPETLKPFVKKKGVSYPIASAKGLPEPFKSIQAIPTTFFIDRRGVIQSVLVGGREYAELKNLAVAKDFEGAPKEKPAPPAASGLKQAETMLQSTLVWSTNVSGATAIASGDWDGSGASQILVASGNRLHVFDVKGAEKSVITLPAMYTAIEYGHHRQKGARILGFTNWGRKIDIIDNSGKELWSYSSLMGVDGAHWGDLDGDGTDELIVGMNGFGGLEAASADGKKIWHASLGNVWGQAVVPAGAGGQALVFATEAGGSVRVFNGQGLALRTLRPQGAYYTKIAAAAMDQSGKVQVLALGQNTAGSGEQVIAFDANGQVAWSTPVRSRGGWVQVHFACGDLEGHGSSDWAFIEPSGDLAVVTASGERLGTIPSQSQINDFLIVSATNQPGLLVTLQGASVQAYAFGH